MRETPIDAETFARAPSVRYVELGSFTDECKALAAWRQALRETRARRVGGDDQAVTDDGEDPEGAAETLEEPVSE